MVVGSVQLTNKLQMVKYPCLVTGTKVNHAPCKISTQYQSIHPPLETRGLYKPLSSRYCACSGFLKITIYCVHKLSLSSSLALHKVRDHFGSVVHPLRSGRTPTPKVNRPLAYRPVDGNFLCQIVLHHQSILHTTPPLAVVPLTLFSYTTIHCDILYIHQYEIVF